MLWLAARWLKAPRATFRRAVGTTLVLVVLNVVLVLFQVVALVTLRAKVGAVPLLLAGAFLHTTERHVAVVSPLLPPSAWRRLARRFGRKIVHVPLKRFGGP